MIPVIPVNHKIRTELIGEASTFNIVRDIIKISYLDAYIKYEKQLLAASCLSVLLFVWNNWAAT
jgi:hypothetical protein